MSVLRDITAGTFRASPHRRLLPRERAPGRALQALGGLAADLNCHGVLLSRDLRGPEITAVCHNTARLLRTLRAPGPLPPEIREPAHGSRELAAKLVLDDVLELEVQGHFVSGLAAYPHVFQGSPDTATRGYTGRLSIDGLKYGQRLGVSDPALLSARLYRYNTAPASPRTSRWPAPSAAEIEGQLALAAGGRAAAWRLAEPVEERDGWTAWSNAAAGGSYSRDRVYKLYISPLIEDLRAALPPVINAIARSDAIAFKLGRGPYGLLRPDKLVVYFGSLADLLEMTKALRPKLAGIRPQGVPFSASITPDGLLSWGLDPPRERQTWGSESEESWRSWVTNRLATALRLAADGDGEVEPWEFALERLRLEGVDTSTFAPIQCA